MADNRTFDKQYANYVRKYKIAQAKRDARMAQGIEAPRLSKMYSKNQFKTMYRAMENDLGPQHKGVNIEQQLVNRQHEYEVSDAQARKLQFALRKLRKQGLITDEEMLTQAQIRMRGIAETYFDLMEGVAETQGMTVGIVFFDSPK